NETLPKKHLVMSYKPEESTLIAYLYEELSEEDMKRVEEYLSGSAEARKELEDLKMSKLFLSNAKDKEVDVPTFTFNNPSSVVVAGGSPSFFWKKLAAIAASIALILLTGYLTNFQLSVGQDGLQVSFERSNENYNQEEVASIIASAIDKNNQLMKKDLVATEVVLRDMILSTQNETKSSAVNLNDVSGINEKLVAQRNELMEVLRGMIESSEVGQKQHIDKVLNDFAVYLDVQRQNDLDVIQSKFNSLENETELNLFQTNTILSNLISNSEKSNHY
ncbi:MAG: hypothetical protein AAFY41_18440, partial [Bacteroidota bacterium]